MTLEPVVLSVDTGRVVRRGADRFVGVNLNYIRDADVNRPQARPLNRVLKDMGVRWLRYPGGEKSDFYLWSQPPYNQPQPASLGWYQTAGGQRMDFDQYMACVRAVGAEPYVVVGYDTEERTGRTRAQWRENAVTWIRYANVVRKYGVRHWEIGNENWHNGTAKPEEMAPIVAEFSRAMKTVDPAIRIGASGNNDAWWSRFLPGAAPFLDFLTLSLYNCWDWKNYRYFAEHPDADTIADVKNALAALARHAPPADRARLRVVVAETNSKDYSENGWPGANTLGHALVTFDTLGRVMAQPRVLAAMVWTTRWMNDAEAKDSQWYALGPRNEVLPTGRAIALWGQFVQSEMIAVDGAAGNVSAYASRSEDGRALSVWILNRGLDPASDVTLRIQSPIPYTRPATIHRLSGAGPDDANPRWKPAGSVDIPDNTLRGLRCPGVSVTVVSLVA